MNKLDVLKFFGEEERVEAVNLYERYILAKERDIPLFSKCFYAPNMWSFFEKKMGSKNFSVTTNGFFEGAERRMISFNNMYEIPFPYKVIKVTNLSKFSSVTHRDYLGALLALGIKREKIGDLLVKDNVCYFPVCEEIEQFIIDNLDSVGKSPCKVEVVSSEFKAPSFEFQDIVILVSALRVDSIVAKLSKISRAKAQNMIEQGKVLIDYNSICDKAAIVDIGSRITIRGQGKFILDNVIGKSKSGKFKVLTKKYT